MAPTRYETGRNLIAQAKEMTKDIVGADEIKWRMNLDANKRITGVINIDFFMASYSLGDAKKITAKVKTRLMTLFLLKGFSLEPKYDCVGGSFEDLAEDVREIRRGKAAVFENFFPPQNKRF